MNARWSFLILVALVVLVASRGSADEPATTCRGTFDATMNLGSSRGWRWAAST